MFATLFATSGDYTRMAAQVVSGIGFLGAGIIFREGLNVRGLNTAATLWCSAAIGVLAGAGAHAHATLATVLVVAVNLVLRRLVRAIHLRPALAAEWASIYTLSVVCRADTEAHVRVLLRQGLTGNLHLQRLESSNIENSDRVAVDAVVGAERRIDPEVEQIVGRLSLEPAVTAARWSVEPVGE